MIVLCDRDLLDSWSIECRSGGKGREIAAYKWIVVLENAQVAHTVEDQGECGV
jgi:hypothetical protein